MKHKFLKLAGVKTEKEFYDKYPDEASFFKAFPKAQKGLAVTPEQQYEGLNNPMYTEMKFPMQGNNVFRGLDNGQPVLLQDSTGKKKILKGNQDTTIMKGTVKEKRIAQSGLSLDEVRKPALKKYLNERPKHSVEGRYSGLEGNQMPTRLESIRGNIEYFKNNTPESNVYRPEFMHHSITEVPLVPIAKHGKSMKDKISKAQWGFITQEKKDKMLWGDQYDNTIPANPDAQPVQANPNYDPNQKLQFVDQGAGTPIPTSSVRTKFQKTNGKATVDHQQSKNNHPSFGVGEAITSGIGMAQMLMGPEGERRRVDNTLAYNPYAYGTGSQAIAKKGKSIKAQQGKTFTPQYNFPTEFNNTKPDYADSISYKIKFNETPKLLKSKSRVSATGANYINPEEHINDTDLDWVMNSGNPYVFNKNPNLRKSIVNEEAAYSDYLKQFSNYYNSETGKLKPGMKAHAKSIGIPMEITPKYKQGGSIKPSHQGQGLMTYEGGNAPKVSENMFDGGTHLFTGDSHEKGGIMSSFNGQPFEAEGGEPFAKIEGKGVVFGDLVNPLTGRTYKKDAKEIMKKELKISKYLDKGTELVNEKDPTDKFERLAFNSGRAMMEGAATKLKQIADSKAHLAELQEAQLELEGEEAFAKHGKVIKAQSGATMFNDPIGPYENPLELIVRDVAAAKGLDPDLFHRVVRQESQYNPKKTSPKNPRTGEFASGLPMLSEANRKKAGFSRKDMESTNPETLTKVLGYAADMLKSSIEKYNGDVEAGLIEYNGGPDAVALARKALKDPNASGTAVASYWENQGIKKPSKDKFLYRNQTPAYIKGIYGGAEASKNFHESFYTTPDFSLPTPQLQGLTPEEIAAMDSKKPNVPNQPAKGSDPYEWQKVEPWKINPTKDKLELSQIMGETAALFDRPDFVEGQRYNPDLYTPYQVSFQDRINQNSKTFNALQSTMAGNPEALATMAGQQYSANDAVLAEEFRTNQAAISNDITNKNVALLNDAKLKNISLIDQQYVRQNQAKSITKQNRTNALNSISSKILQKKASNNLLNTYKNLFPHYDFDNNYQVVKQGPGGEQYVTFPTQIGTNPFAVTDKKTQTTYGPDGEKKSEKVTTDPSYIRDKGYLDLEKLRKQISGMTFNGNIIKQYKGSN